MSEPQIDIDIDNRSSYEINDDDSKCIENAAKATLDELGFNGKYELSVSVVDEDEIKQLNSIYRDTDSVTDVLSFPLDDVAPNGVILLGDVVICANRAKQQAEEFAHAFAREISYLTVHSVLHLLGYDHMTDEDKTKMRAQEKLTMKRLGIFKDGSFNE